MPEGAVDAAATGRGRLMSDARPRSAARSEVTCPEIVGRRSTRTATSSPCCSTCRLTTATCPKPVVDEIARLSGVPASRIYGIVTFYAQFSTEPSGRHKVFVCHGTACHVAGAPRITEAIEQELGVRRRRHDARHELHARLGGLHGRLLAGAGHAYRRRHLRQHHARRDPQVHPRRARGRSASRRRRTAPAGSSGRRCPPSTLDRGRPPDREQVRAASRRRRAGRDGKRRVQVCAGTACVFAGSLKMFARLRDGDRGGRSGRRGRGRHHRLSRPLLAGAARRR